MSCRKSNDNITGGGGVIMVVTTEEATAEILELQKIILKFLEQTPKVQKNF